MNITDSRKRNRPARLAVCILLSLALILGLMPTPFGSGNETAGDRFGGVLVAHAAGTTVNVKQFFPWYGKEFFLSAVSTFFLGRVSTFFPGTVSTFFSCMVSTFFLRSNLTLCPV
jgi:hypothetical protein